MESQIKIKATVPEMSAFFEKDGGVRFYEIKDKRFSAEELKAMPEDKYNSEIFTFDVRYRHMELPKPLTGTFTIDKLTKTMDDYKETEAFLRKMALDGLVIKLDLPELKQMISLLRYTSNNINQIAKRLNESGRAYETDFADILEKQNQLWGLANEILMKLSSIQ